MPQISVEYSDSIADAFDRRGFALALHSGGGEVIGSSLPGFKTRFRTTGETVIGDGDPGEAMVHLEIAILPGRDEETKTRLGELTLKLLADHLKPVDGLNVQLTVEIRDLANYSKQVIAKA
ncbi:isomerase [Kribbella antibiotica]|uniref:Isomerase n=1 Tax=Kribbella antibiotica TaxID=190195 RepID=A0A4R4ZUZ5_9ACTN|nr:isomerase [Kribbella antibiotica]TDD62695.1 isomerase [Kribbella antibiotica]